MQNSQTKSFITLGEAMALFVAKTPGKLSEVENFSRSLAGAEVNVAIGMARLGFESTYVSKVGDDCFGEYVRTAISQEGISTDNISLSPEQATGFMLKSNVTDGSDPITQYFRRNSAASTLSASDIKAELFKPGAHLHITGVAAAISETVRDAIKQAIHFAKAQGCSISFDTNLRPALWSDRQVMVDTINEFAFNSDIILPGIEEGLILMGSEEPEAIADFYLNNGAKAVIVKLGSKGAYYKTVSGDSGIVEGFPVAQVVDTVGAGDSFAAGVISALLDGKDMAQAARRGNLLGSMTVQVSGDSEALPTREQLISLEG